METPLCLETLGECSLCPLYRPANRSYPRTWRTATLAAKERTDVRQDGIGEVEYCLKWAESKDTEAEGPGKPLSAGQVPQDLRNGFSTELHGTVRHQEVNSRVSIPNIQVWIQRPKCLRILPNGSFDNARISGFARF